ncbi:unnamed protein product [Camellia sinensis]
MNLMLPKHWKSENGVGPDDRDGEVDAEFILSPLQIVLLTTSGVEEDVANSAVVKYQKNPLRALEMFNSVRNEEGFRHNLLTYKCMIEKLGFHGEFEAMERVLAELRMNVENSLLEGVYIGAMRSYGRKGNVQEAVDVFERMDFYNCDPSVQSYNAIMNILVEYGYFNQAHKVYMRMRDKKVVPDVHTFTIRIKSFCRTRRPHTALRLLKNIPSHGCELNAVAYCTVASGFYEENFRVEAYELFDEMLRNGICPSITTFNKLMHTLSKKGDVQESEKLLNKVLKRGVSPNLFTFNIFIQGLCRKGLLKEASSMVDSLMREGLSPDVVTYNTLICGLSKNFRVAEAENCLQRMVNEGFEPDAFTYNIIIDGYCKLGMIQNAYRILNDAVFKGFLPDKFTYCSLINGLCQDGDIDRAMSVFNEALRKGLKPNIIIYNTLIKGLSQGGLILQALELMNEMPENGCNPDIWTYNLVINGLCKMGCVLDAHNLMSDAMAKGFLPDIFTFNTLIDGYCKQLKMDNAIEMLNGMWDNGVIPDVITYNSVLNGLCKTAKSDDVLEAFTAMLEKGCVPNIITYNILIESLCKARKLVEALSLLEEMENKGMSPDVVSFGTLISGFYENRDVVGAYELFRRMEQQYKFMHTTATYNIMIHAFSEKLQMDMSQKLFHEMIDNGCPPDNYTYRVMIDGFCKTDNVDSGYKFLLDKIEKGFIPALTTFGRVINSLCLKHKVREAVGIVHLMVRKGIVPDIVNTIFEADKKEVAAPKIVVEDLLKKSHIIYYAYELLYDGIRDKKLIKKKLPRSCANDPRKSSSKQNRRAKPKWETSTTEWLLLLSCIQIDLIGRRIFMQRLETGNRDGDIEQCRVGISEANLCFNSCLEKHQLSLKRVFKVTDAQSFTGRDMAIAMITSSANTRKRLARFTSNLRFLRRSLGIKSKMFAKKHYAEMAQMKKTLATIKWDSMASSNKPKIVERDVKEKEYKGVDKDTF